MSARASEATVRQIADELWHARRTRTTIPPVRDRLPHLDLDAAYAISEHNTARRENEEGVIRVGRKVGLTNEIVQRMVGVDQPDYGIITDDMVHADGVVCPRAAFVDPRIEAEIAFVLKDDIHESSLECILRAIDYVTPALEIVDCHYADYDMQIVDTIADNAAGAGVVLGNVRMPYGTVDLPSLEMVLTRGGVEVTRGTGINVMKDPVNAIVWLARTAIERGFPLRAGEILLSGSIGTIVPWDADMTYTATITGLGSVSATLESELK